MKSIEITLNLASPLFVAYPDNVDKTSKISRTLKQPVMVDGAMQYIPYYPANGFRGGLRRKAMAHLLTHFNENEGTVPASLYLGLACGASSASPDNTPLSIEELIRARKNVYMGLFGGGARLLESSYRVSDMLPIIASTIKTGMVPSRYADTVKAIELESGQARHLQPWEVVGQRTPIRVDDLYRIMNPSQIMTSVTDAIAAVAQHQGATQANQQERKNAKAEGEEVKKQGVANLMSMEAIAAGTPFYFRIDLDETVIDDAKLGMMLMCLSDLFQANQFGGWGRCGFGKVRVQTISINTEEDTLLLTDLHNENDVFTLPGSVQHLVAAAKDAIATLSIADMQGFFVDFSADKKAEDAAKLKAQKAEKAAQKAAQNATQDAGEVH